MADDRDRRVHRTPPPGVRIQTAQPMTDWDPDAEPTPPPIDVPEALVQVTRRQRQTQQTTQGTKDAVHALRDEVSQKFSTVDHKFAELSSHVGELGERTYHMAGKVDILVETLATDRVERSTIRLATATAETAAGRRWRTCAGRCRSSRLAATCASWRAAA